MGGVIPLVVTGDSNGGRCGCGGQADKPTNRAHKTMAGGSGGDRAGQGTSVQQPKDAESACLAGISA